MFGGSSPRRRRRGCRSGRRRDRCPTRCAPDASCGLRLAGDADRRRRTSDRRRARPRAWRRAGPTRRGCRRGAGASSGRRSGSREFMMRSSERRVGREHEREAFVALRELDAQRRRHRAVQAEADAVVALQAVEVQVATCGRSPCRRRRRGRCRRSGSRARATRPAAAGCCDRGSASSRTRAGSSRRRAPAA